MIRERDVQSDAIEVARVFLVVGLVCLHYFAFPNVSIEPTYGFDPAHHQAATFVNSFIQFFFFSSVPLLSAISGWLFFSSMSDPATIRRRMRGKVRSLLLPMVSWNALYVAIALLWSVVRPGSTILREVGDLNYDHLTIVGVINSILGITHLPIGVQFWFIHDLFLATMMGPLLLLALRRAPFVGALLLAGAWLYGSTLFVFFRTDVLFFFYLGGLMRQQGITRPVISWGTTRVLLIFYLGLIALRVCAPLYVEPTPWLEAATRLMRLVGVVVCWGLCLRFAAGSLGPALARYGGFAFFLHAIHYPLIVVVKQVLWGLIPAETDGWMIAQYAATIALTTLIAVAAGATVFRAAPQLYSFLAGGRTFHQVSGRARRRASGVDALSSA